MKNYKHESTRNDGLPNGNYTNCVYLDFGFATREAEQRIPIIPGEGTLLNSMTSNNESAVFKILSKKMHLNLDLISGILLAASPWIFGFSETVMAPHLILGL